jgi:hypothetical protein
MKAFYNGWAEDGARRRQNCGHGEQLSASMAGSKVPFRIGRAEAEWFRENLIL